MRLGRTRDEEEQALVDSRDALKAATGRLEDAVKDRRKQLEMAQKQLGRTHDDYRKRVERAQKAVTEAGQSKKIGGGVFGPVKLYDDRITINGKTHSLSPEVQATVDTAGNLSSTRRHTLTRFALLGPLSLFTPKKTKHDDRELFLLVEGPDWAELVKCEVKQQASTRTLAQSINVAARQVEQARADRRARVEEAQAELAAARADQTAIETAERELIAAHSATEAIVTSRDELLGLVGSHSGREAKEVRKAEGLVSEVQNLLAEQLELPPSPADALESAPAPLELEAGDDPAPEPAEPAEAAAASGSNGDTIEQIRGLGELRDAGLLTAEEFEAKKAELLARL
jgi:hypothetical protein